MLWAAVAAGAPPAVPVENTYWPCSTRSGPCALMSPWTTPRALSGTGTVTVADWPAARCTRVKPTTRLDGTSTALTGWDTKTGTTRSPAVEPVVATATLTETPPLPVPPDPPALATDAAVEA